MKSKKLAGKKVKVSTQQYLDIAEIREDVVIMKDGSMRAVLLVSSINFALKSAEEQEALVAAYVGFLNTLEWPLQIMVQSRKLNIDAYLDQLRQAEKAQTNELLKVQIGDYVNFVSELVELGQIMTKKFFVTVAFNPLAAKKKGGFFSGLKEIFTPAALVRLQRERFLERKKDLMSRVNQVAGQLGSMGLQAVQLDTQSLIELYYTSYNPEVRETQKLAEVGRLQLEAQ